MVRSQLRRNNAYVAKKSFVSYKPGSVCFVLSQDDCMALVQFYCLLMTIERRMKDSLQSSSDPKSNIGPRKTKGSQSSGPFLFSRVFVWGCGWIFGSIIFANHNFYSLLNIDLILFFNQNIATKKNIKNKNSITMHCP